MGGNFNKIVTDYFMFFEPMINDPSKVVLRPGLETLALALLQASAQEIIVPHAELRFGQPMDDVVGSFPPSLRNRVKIVDKHHQLKKRVERYLEPVREQLDCKYPEFDLQFASSVVYKLSIASAYKAEIDLPMFYLVRPLLHHLADKLVGEARVRIDNIIGIWNLYNFVDSVPVPSLESDLADPSIKSRIHDLLDESDLIRYSQHRYMLGMPSRAIQAFMFLKKWGRDVMTGAKHLRFFQLAQEAIMFVSTTVADMPITIPNLSGLISEYNPPIVDLDSYRIQLAKKARPDVFPSFVMADGSSRTGSQEIMRNYKDFMNIVFSQ